MDKPKVNNQHPDYADKQAKRDVFDAVKGGTDSIRKGRKKWLDKYDGELEPDYTKRLNKATIDGIVMGGIDTLTGQIFADEIDTSGVRIPLEWIENFDNKGNSLNAFAKMCQIESFDGFALILTDMPANNPDLQQAREVYGAEADKTFNMRPYARLYTANNVINWDFETDPQTHTERLVFLVLRESNQMRVNRFEYKDIVRYRVYELLNNVVTWQLYEEQTKGNQAEFVLVESGILSNKTEIPYATVGDFCDDPKLLAESRLEMKAYEKESSFDVCEYYQIPTLWTKGYEKEKNGRLMVGAASHIELPDSPDADVGYLQLDAAGHASLKATIDGIKSTIESRINQYVNEAVDKTATESIIESKDKKARLVVWADGLKNAMNKTLRHFGDFAGIADVGEVELNTSWKVKAEAVPITGAPKVEQPKEMVM